MRRKLVLGVGLAALVGSTATGQFAVDRVPPVSTPMGVPKTAPAPLPGGLTPVGPVSPTPPAPTLGGFQPLAPSAPVAPARPAAPASPGGLYSSPPGAYVPPTDGLRPASYSTPAPNTPAPVAAFPTQPINFEIPSAIPKNHPWLIKPEHGPYFIMVKSYVRPAKGSKAAQEDKGLSAPELAEMLASEIRDVHRVQAFLFEYISEERKAEMRAYLAAKQKAQKEYIAQVNALRQKSQLQGMEFIEPDNMFRVMKHDQRDQIGVLVGGFQNEKDAVEALAILKKWELPKNEVLLDKAILNDKNTQEAKGAFINPYASAFVVPNPVIAKATQPNTGKPQPFDPFLVKFNEGHPYNLLKATKGWTLAVKSFAAPVEIVNNNSDTSLMKKFGLGKSGTDVLLAGELQAEAMAKALRSMKGPNGQPLNLEAFVLHTRNASLVTIGQFDSPDDPAMHATRRLLLGIKGNVSEDQAGLRPTVNAPTLFDTILPMPIPKP